MDVIEISRGYHRRSIQYLYFYENVGNLVLIPPHALSAQLSQRNRHKRIKLMEAIVKLLLLRYNRKYIYSAPAVGLQNPEDKETTEGKTKDDCSSRFIDNHHEKRGK